MHFPSQCNQSVVSQLTLGGHEDRVYLVHVLSIQHCCNFLVCAQQECGPLDSEAMVMGVLDQSFDVLVLRYGVQKRVYCKVSRSTLEQFRS